MLIVGLALVGLTLGVVGGFTTQVRAGERGVALARVGWIAGGLLVLGIGARLAFAFAIGHGFEPAVRSFCIAHQIGAAAWPVALVMMAADRGRLPDRRRAGPRPPPRHSVTPIDIDTDRIRPVSAGRAAFYRLPVDTPESAREQAARARACSGSAASAIRCGPLGLVVIAAVVVGAINGHPTPAGHG